MLAMLLSASGVLVISLSYAAGRDGHPWAPVAYWGGHLLTFIPLAAYVLARRTPSKWAAVVGIGLFQSLTKWMYSPLMFKFSDELQHRQTAIDIQKYHSLFHANLALPVSPQFPGLEEITTSLMSMTGLNLFAAGQIVAGVAHVSVALGIFVLLRRVTRDEWVAAVAVLVFEISPQNPFFNAMWAYETPALLFMVVALIGATRRGSVPGFITAVICLGRRNGYPPRHRRDDCAHAVGSWRWRGVTDPSVAPRTATARAGRRSRQRWPRRGWFLSRRRRTSTSPDR